MNRKNETGGNLSEAIFYRSSVVATRPLPPATAKLYALRMDHLTPERRSWNMSRIKGKDTKPEVIVRSMLHRINQRAESRRQESARLMGHPEYFRYKEVKKTRSSVGILMLSALLMRRAMFCSKQITV
jgi:hypothetical protein